MSSDRHPHLLFTHPAPWTLSLTCRGPTRMCWNTPPRSTPCCLWQACGYGVGLQRLAWACEPTHLICRAEGGAGSRAALAPCPGIRMAPPNPRSSRPPRPPPVPSTCWAACSISRGTARACRRTACAAVSGVCLGRALGLGPAAAGSRAPRRGDRPRLATPAPSTSHCCTAEFMYLGLTSLLGMTCYFAAELLRGL